MRSVLPVCASSALLLLAPAAAVAQSSWPTIRVEFVQGFEAASALQQDPYFDGMKVTFAGHKVFRHANRDQTSPDVLDRDGALQSILRSDVWVFSGHSGPIRPYADQPPMHVLQVKGTGGERDFLTATQLTAALRGRAGPRLVVVNGCETMNPNDGVSGEYRLSTAFGITPASKGRAYLGWTTGINPLTSDARIAGLLEVWTRFSEEVGDFPTLRQAIDIASKSKARPNMAALQEVRVVGDENLRYSHPYVLAPRLPGEKLGPGETRVFWNRTGPTTGQMLYDMGGSEKALKDQAALGIKRFIPYEGTQEEDSESFDCRSKAFEDVIVKGHQLVIKSLDKQSGGQTKTRVEAEVRALIRPEGRDFLLDITIETATYRSRPDRPGEEVKKQRNVVKLIAKPVKDRTSLLSAVR